jgi:FkbM family methyltransferase
MVDRMFIQYDLNDIGSSRFNVMNKGSSGNYTIVCFDANYNIPLNYLNTFLESGSNIWFTPPKSLVDYVQDPKFNGFRYLVINNDTGDKHEYKSQMNISKELDITLPDIYLYPDDNDSYYDCIYTDKLKYLFEKEYTGWFIDVGANLGSYTAAYLRYINGKALMIEPTPILFDSLIKTFENYKNIHVLHGAITNKTDLNINLELFDMASVANRVSENGIKVPNYRISEVIKKYNIDEISLLKLDIEGQEYEVIGGLESWILDMTNSISLECHNYYGHTNDNVIEKILSHNFNIETIRETTSHSEYFFWK